MAITAIKVFRLDEAIRAVCPIDGISVPTIGVSATVTIVFSASATAPQRTAAQNALTAFDWSDAADDAWQNLRDRSSAIGTYQTFTTDQAKLFRAVALVILDELNILREFDASLKAAVAAATSLATLQTQIAALPNTPDRVASQISTAIQAKINSGIVD